MGQAATKRGARFAGISDLLTEFSGTSDDLTHDQGTDVLSMVKAFGFDTEGIRPGTPEFVDFLAQMDWQAVSKAKDDAESKREERSKKYKIAVKDGGNLTPPADYPTDPALYADPVNLAYRLDDKAHADNAAARWGDTSNQKGYSNEEKAIIEERIAAAQKKFNGGDDGKKKADKTIFVNQEERARVSGIQVKAFEYDEPTDDSRTEPDVWADFTHHQFRIDTPDAVAAAKVAFKAATTYRPDFYEPAEAKLIERNIEAAETRLATKAADDTKKKPKMISCPHCDKPMPEGTGNCPHCGKAISEEDQKDGGSDDSSEPTAAAKSAFATEARAAAESAIKAFETGDGDAVIAATKALMLLSHKTAERQTEIDLDTAQGIHDHAAFMKAKCSVHNVSGPIGATKGADGTTGDMEQALTDANAKIADLETRLAQAENGNAPLVAEKSAREAAETERDELRIKLEVAEGANTALLSDIQAKSARIQKLEEGEPTPSGDPLRMRKSVSLTGGGAPAIEKSFEDPSAGRPTTFWEEFAAEQAEGE